MKTRCLYQRGISDEINEKLNSVQKKWSQADASTYFELDLARNPPSLNSGCITLLQLFALLVKFAQIGRNGTPCQGFIARRKPRMSLLRLSILIS